MPLLELSGIFKSYGAVAALDGVDLAVEAGERFAIVGPSGSGKSTLLRVLAGHEQPDRGRLVLGGAVLSEAGSGIPAHRRDIGVVAQDGSLFPHLSVADNIGFGLDRRLPDRAARIDALIELVELDSSMLARRPDQLSGGQQQRVALARALARRPRLMLLDEPFSALDAGLRAATRRAVARVLDAAGVTTILVTHDQTEALAFADRLAVMRQGRLPQIGTPRELYTAPRDAMIAAFLGEAILLPAFVEGGTARCALGSVGVGDDAPPGEREILIRPEQIVASNAEADDACGVRGRVVGIEFGGGTSLVTFELDQDGDRPPLRISIHRLGSGATESGASVRLGVVGLAHVFREKGRA